MSVVVAVKNPVTGDIVIGSDRKIIAGDMLFGKTIKHLVYPDINLCVGYCGDCRGLSILINHFVPEPFYSDPTCRLTPEHEALVQYNAQINELFSYHNYDAKLDKEGFGGFEMILCCNGTMMMSSSDGNLIKVDDNFCSIGAGATVVMGLLSYIFDEKYEGNINNDNDNDFLISKINDVLEICYEYVPSTGCGTDITVMKHQEFLVIPSEDELYPDELVFNKDIDSINLTVN